MDRRIALRDLLEMRLLTASELRAAADRMERMATVLRNLADEIPALPGSPVASPGGRLDPPISD
jgi:hypothetical protein